MYRTSVLTGGSRRLASAVVMAAGFVLAGVAAATLAAPPAAADEMESSYARGGKLYDKWYKVIDVDAPKLKPLQEIMLLAAASAPSHRHCVDEIREVATQGIVDIYKELNELAQREPKEKDSDDR